MFQEVRLFGGLASLIPNTELLHFCLCVEVKSCCLGSFYYMLETGLVVLPPGVDIIG